ncbi:membrane protein [Methylobacterium gregans]|uniref:DUF2232 domain-containing protein n=1 Tax=Methylobacterium gregans TaxID=374424 RepID=A0AA37HM51_9HYPH|nr:DUF2232 domain-containing protein [Methylobacterium gregans]MDQ0520786.1 hypothetical protein [Methylobacterium gregans]GJD78319.1 hypothetical protein NBEOAGPD_1533 [Methylobacterium gregans]GLS53266.1 membrane protein [Methylobacterium gregans]
MTQYLGIGIGAGLVSALLFGVLLKGTLLAFVLNLVSPLPILIVGLGWSHRAALAAAVTGSLALALAVSPSLGLGFAAYLALPAWWLAYLTLLGRQNPDGTGATGTTEWYPTGRLLGWVGTTAGAAVVAIALLSSSSYEAYETQMRQLAGNLIRVQMRGAPAPAPVPRAEQDGEQAAERGPEAPAESADPKVKAQAELQAELAEAMGRLLPGIAATGLALLLVFYLWASARIVRLSGRLLRPWPDIPSTIMPRGMLGLLAVAVVLTLAPGYLGVFGTALVGALCAVFALQGLAAFHDRSRGRPGRGALLFGLYLILFVTQGIALVALTLFGLADTALDRRRPRGGPAT